VAKFSYFGMSHEEIKSKLHSQNACSHSAHNLSSRLVSRRNVEIKIYKTTNFPVSFDGCESWFLILREEHRLLTTNNRVFRRSFGNEREIVIDICRKLHIEKLNNFCSLTNRIRANQGR
jgi:hypothetical protein